MAKTATVDDPAKDESEFDAGWNDDEFKPPDTTLAKTDDDPPANTVDDPPAKTVDDPPAKTDDDPPAKTDDDPPAKTDDDPPVVAKTETDYTPSYKDVVDEIKKTETRLIDTLVAKSDPKPKVEDKTTPARVDLSEFTGDKLKSRLEKVRDVAPEAADAFEPIIEGLAGALGNSYKEVDSLTATHVKDQAEQAQAGVESQVETKHTDWKQTVKSKEFKDWLGEQPSYVKRVAEETDDPGEFITILDQFVASTDPPAKTDDDPPAKTDDDPPAKTVDDPPDGDEEARRVALRAASKQPDTKTKSERVPSKKRVLSEAEEFESGWNDREFEVRRA